MRQKSPILFVAITLLALGVACSNRGEVELLPTATSAEFADGSTPVPLAATNETMTEAIATPEATAERFTSLPYSTVDRPDDVDGYQVHFIYALPSDGDDEFLDVDGRIERSANAMNQWLMERTAGTGLRYDTYQGDLDVSFLQLDYSADEISSLGTRILALLDHEIKVRGFDTSSKIYVVYYDGFFVSEDGFCGLANYPPDGWGVTAVLLLRAYIPRFDQPCPRQFSQSEDYTGYFEMTILHEVLHILGMAPACGASVESGHVMDSSQDLMYASYDGSYSPVYTLLDEDHDDYFGHGDPDCPDFARSVFLDPLPADAETPPAWEFSSSRIGPNPFDVTETPEP